VKANVIVVYIAMVRSRECVNVRNVFYLEIYFLPVIVVKCDAIVTAHQDTSDTDSDPKHGEKG